MDGQYSGTHWLMNPGNNWKVFVANPVWKVATVTEKLNISWTYCPTDKNIADLGSRGASVDKMEKDGGFTGPEWLQREEKWQDTSAFNAGKRGRKAIERGRSER